jgi:hypothetical protein
MYRNPVLLMGISPIIGFYLSIMWYINAKYNTVLKSTRPEKLSN